MKKLLIFINCFIICFSAVILPCCAAAETKSYGMEPPAYATDIALLVNSDTDTVIYSKNPDKITAPASLTKLVTALVALSECSDLEKVITCSPKAIQSLLNTGSSVAGLYENEEAPFEMLLYCLFLPSANDAAAVLADHFGNGDASKFVQKMNDLVKKLGCKNTYFANPHGLDDESIKGFDSPKQNKTTAYDMYLIAKEALKNETIRRISSKYGKTMPATNKSGIRYLYNTNSLLNNYSEDYYYEDAIGLKTGTTDKAGACLITSASKNGYTYIAIAMRGVLDYRDKDTGRGNLNSAFLMCRYMLKWAFSNMQMKMLADTSRNLGEVEVEYGMGNDYVGLVPAQNVSAIVQKDIDIDDLEVVFANDFPEKVKAPVKQGDVIGNATLKYGDNEIADVTLVAQQSVKKNYLWAVFSGIEKSVSSKAFLIFSAAVIIIIIIIANMTKKKRKQKKRRKNSVEVITDYSALAKK